MNIQEIEKSKINQIESKAQAILYYFGKDNEELKKELEELLHLVKSEKDSREQLREVIWAVANKS